MKVILCKMLVFAVCTLFFHSALMFTFLVERAWYFSIIYLTKTRNICIIHSLIATPSSEAGNSTVSILLNVLHQLKKSNDGFIPKTLWLNWKFSKGSISALLCHLSWKEVRPCYRKRVHEFQTKQPSVLCNDGFWRPGWYQHCRSSSFNLSPVWCGLS